MDLSSIARRLPDEFLTAPGLPVQRVILLAHRHWPSRSDSELRALAVALRPLLEPMLKASRPEVTAEIRNGCERVVREWNEQLSERSRQ